MSVDSTAHIQEFMTYFTGSRYSFGQHIYGKIDTNGKRSGKSNTISNRLLTFEDYKKHLNGEIGLGIVPINENAKCKFSVIDVDIYKKDLSIYMEAIDKFNFPIVPFKSKSGGLHLYTFYKEEVSARNAIALMRKFSFLLSIDFLYKKYMGRSIEIFPKQTKVSEENLGNWINLPYFGRNPDTGENIPLTPAIHRGKNLSLEQVIVLIRERLTTYSKAQDFIADLPLKDAPPCLQLINILNPIKEGSGGGRNNYLFSLGVYYKKKDEDFYQSHIKEANITLQEPISEKELDITVIKSLEKKDYMYRCKDMPCVDFCNKKVCKERLYGIGKDDGFFSSVECGQLYQYKTNQPYYEWEVKLQDQEDFKLLRFKSEDEVIRQDVFLKLCMRELYELPSKLKQSEWFNTVNQALKEIKVVEVDEEDDTSPFVMLKGLLFEFLTGKAMAETKEQIMSKRVYFDPRIDMYYFRSKDFMDFLFIQKQFKYFAPGEMHGILKGLNCSYTKLRTESKKEIRVVGIHKSVISLQEDQPIYDVNFENGEEEF